MTTHPTSTRYQDEELRLLAMLISGKYRADMVAPEKWHILLELALQHQVAPVLLWVVNQANPEIAAGQHWQQVWNTARSGALHHIWLEKAQLEITRAFATAEIPTIWLKGIALAASVYPQPALRLMSDLDLLVPYDKRRHALNVARGLGFDFFASTNLTGVAVPEWERSHHYQLLRRGGSDISLEIHYRIINDGDLTPHHEELWFVDQIDTTLPHLPMLKPEAFLLHLCAHALIHHGESYTRLSNFYDIHRLITCKPMNWDLMIERAVALRWSYAVEQALRITQSLFETPIPEFVLHALDAKRLADENVSRVIALQGQGTNLELVLGIIRNLPLKEQIRVLSSFVFPARVYVRAQYNVPLDTPLWRFYFRRWFQQLKTIFWWIYERLTQSR